MHVHTGRELTHARTHARPSARTHARAHPHTNAQKRLAMALMDDVMEAVTKYPGAGERYVTTFLPHMLLGAMSTDMELRQVCE